jgi:hypothetical protein
VWHFTPYTEIEIAAEEEDDEMGEEAANEEVANEADANDDMPGK